MPQRQPLADISTNRRPNHELSPGTKRQFLGRFLAGQTNAEIARAERVSKSTVSTTLNKVTKRKSVDNTPRSGRPKVYTPADERRVVRCARNNPKWTYKQLKDDTGLNWSYNTFYRILKSHGIINWRCKKRPALTAHYARLRLAFARQYLNYDWSNTLFSDECTAEKGAGKKTQWAFGYPHEKWTKERIQPFDKSKQATVMVWACIGSSIERSELIIMERDENSPRGGYNSISYTDTLQEGLVPIYDGQLFMQDNASVHTSRHTTTWLATTGILLFLNWLPYSPNLNPIEHLWARLKEMVYELRPDLDDVTSKAEQERILVEVLPAAWLAIRSEVVHGCLDSMKNRLQAVIDARGWQTKY